MSSDGEVNSYYRKLEDWEHPQGDESTDDTFNMTGTSSRTGFQIDATKTCLKRALKAGANLEQMYKRIDDDMTQVI